MSALDFISSGPRRLCNWYCGASATRVEASADQSESGAALVEFTVLMPLFFLIFFGIIEFGLIFFYQNTMLSAAEATARAVAVNGYTTSTLIKQYSPVCSWLPSSLTFNITATISSPPSPCSYPNPQYVTVVITTNTAKASVINYLNMLSGNLSGTASMHWEGLCQPAATIPFTCP